METIGDIIAEMREYNESTNPPWVCFNEDGGVNITNLIDRIEAAVVRENRTCQESQQVDDTAKMREALKMFVDKYKTTSYTLCLENLRPVFQKAEAALSAPVRNCDNYLTPKDAMLAHLGEVYEGEKVEFGDYEWCEFVKWLFAEVKGEME
jgi:hypothetical protein